MPDDLYAMTLQLGGSIEEMGRELTLFHAAEDMLDILCMVEIDGRHGINFAAKIRKDMAYLHDFLENTLLL